MQPTPIPVLQEPQGLIIEPYDTLFFRDGRPFGPTDFGRSQLPLPQTIAGMIRTYLMHALGLKSSQIHNLREDSNGVKPYQRVLAFIACRGPWIVKIKNDKIEDLFVPPPAHLCRFKKDKNRLVLLRPLDSGDDLPGWRESPAGQKGVRPVIYTESNDAIEAEIRWLGKDAIAAVLKGKNPDIKDLIEPEKLFIWEERTGVTISPDTYTGEDSQLYSTRQLRLQKNIALYAEIGWETVDKIQEVTLREIQADFEKWGDNQTGFGWGRVFPETRVILPFGGEGRRVGVKNIAPYDWDGLSSAPCDGKRAFTWLISPLINNQHERTNGTREPWLPMSCAKLAAAVCSKPLAVSGWDLAGEEREKWKSRPRPTKCAVPAGAVYFWERGNNADPEKPFISNDTLVQLAENAKDRANGWGMALKGVW